MTAGDPVDYLEGLGQTQANEKIGCLFFILRAFLRQDPEVILVGEIRDQEAVGAVKAALTGHLLLSTLHTNDAVRPYRACSIWAYRVL